MNYIAFTLLLFVFNLVEVFAQENRWIDDIVVDSTSDEAGFKICNADDQIIQYINDGNGVQYRGGKQVIDSLFLSVYHPVDSRESGLVRIRFIVNCKGETGRFRLLSSDLNYQPFQFSPAITTQLMNIAKAMKDWEPKIWKKSKVDYYQYLIFKIENGKLTHILP